jgi:hypothetical protein
MTENNKKKKSIFFKIFKRISVSHLIFLMILLIANSYAWFIYVNTVSNSVDVHVRSWKITFDGGEQVVNYINVNVENVYPGMTTFTRDIDAYNYGELPADVTYSILSANIMGDVYITQEGTTDQGQVFNPSDLTSAQLEQKLAEDYPFEISFNLSDSVMAPENGSTTYTVSVSWPYESGDDDLDTYWGVRAYDYMEEHPGEPCIELSIKIFISQASS